MKKEALLQKLKKETNLRKIAEQTLKKREQQHRSLSKQILLENEEDRKTISRELHDVISQTLIGINLNLAALKNTENNNYKDIKKKITKTQQLVEKSVKSIHNFARKLRPTLLDDLGLIPAIRSYIKDIDLQSNTKVYFTAFKDVKYLNNFDRTLLYRVAQEALINVVKHALASQVNINIKKNEHTLCLEIKDNGKSFKIEKTYRKGNKRLGLLGMRERLEAVNGSLTVKSSQDKGTIIQAFIPLKK